MHESIMAASMMRRLLDHLVSANEDRRRDRQAEGFGGLEVDEEPVPRRGEVEGSTAAISS
jgi:hypothetical protein